MNIRSFKYFNKIQLKEKMSKDLKRKVGNEMNENGSSLRAIVESIKTIFNEPELNSNFVRDTLNNQRKKLKKLDNVYNFDTRKIRLVNSTILHFF